MSALPHALAVAFLSVEWRADSLRAVGASVLGADPEWLGDLVEHVLHGFRDSPLPERAVLTAFLRADLSFLEVAHELRVPSAPVEYVAAPTPFVPVRGAPETWDVPRWRSVAEVAACFGVSVPALDAFADRLTFGRRAPPGPLRNYDYRWVARPSGLRLLEMPRRRLKAIQRRLLHDVLDRIPPHEAAHGFRAGRSLRTCLDGHAGHEVVVRMDLAQWFPSIRAARVLAVFRTAGYPDDVATVLTGLATSRVPDDVLDSAPREGRSMSSRWLTLQHYRFAHLPQGAPTSPALANLCAFRLDRRLSGLARAAGAHYTRYADDLVFSGDDRFRRSLPRFLPRVPRVVEAEGFRLAAAKTRVMGRSARQSFGGLVLNVRPGPSRRERELLEAILHNCVRHGPASQNRAGHPDFRAHLAGRIAWVSSFLPEHGRQLQDLWARIEW